MIAPTELSSGTPGLCDGLRAYLREKSDARLYALGDLSILRSRRLGFFCSAKCPATIIIQAYDAAVALREAGVTVVSGFHSPIEKDCLKFLLRGRQPVIICPARGIERMRLPREWQEPLAEGRLLLLSPFPASDRRVTAPLAQRRNEFVRTIADAILVVHASERSRTMEVCTTTIEQGTPLWVIDNPHNAGLLAAGARPFPMVDLANLW